MKRRAFLGSAGAALTALPVAPALARTRRELTMISVWPESVPGAGAARIAERITAASDSALTVNVVPSGSLVPPFETFDAVAAGKADLYYGAEFFWHFKSPAFSLFSGLPFGLTATELNAWIRHGGGQKHWDALSARFNLKPFLAGNLGGQLGGWFRREIETVDDLKGLRISIPGLAGAALRRLDADAVSTPVETLHDALDSGFLDAAVGLGPWLDLELALHEVAPHYYYPGFHQPGTALSCVINADSWAKLTATERLLIELATAAENDWTLAEHTARNANALRTLRREKQVNVQHFPADVLSTIGAAAGELVGEARDTGDDQTKAAYRSFLQFRRRAMSLSKHTDQSFADSRLLPFRYAPS